jgi:hypothetical protein
MGLEQRKFDLEEHQEPQEIIQPAPEGLKSSERGSNVIEFPKREPDSESIRLKEDASEEKEAALGKLRAEILEFPKPKEETVAPSDATPEASKENDPKDMGFSEHFEVFKKCEACGGRGRLGLFGLGKQCPVCKGLGRVTVTSESQSGYYDGRTGEKHID